MAESLSKGPEQIEYRTTYKKRPLEMVRVSILEENAIFRNVLYQTLNNLDLDHFEMEIKEFQATFDYHRLLIQSRNPSPPTSLPNILVSFFLRETFPVLPARGISNNSALVFHHSRYLSENPLVLRFPPLRL